MLSDRVGRKKLAALGLVMLSLTSFLLYFSRTPSQMVWVYLFFGAGLAAFGPTMMSLVADISPPTHLGRSYGWYTTALYSSMTLGPALGGYIAQHYGFGKVFLSSGVIIFLIIWALMFLLPGANLYSAERANPDKRAKVVGELLRNRPLIGCWLATLGGCFGLGMFVTYLPLHAQNQGLELGQIGLVFAMQGLANATSRIPFGHLSDQVTHRKNLVVYGFVGFAAALGGLGAAHGIAGFLGCSIAFGISMGLAFTAVGALIAEAVPPSQRGLAMGGYNTCIYFGMMLSSAIMGPVIKAFDFVNAFLIAGVVNLFLVGLFFLLMKDFSSHSRVENR